MTPFRPIVPTGPTYRAGKWVPTQEDITSFLYTCKELNLDAANFFSWDECRPAYPELWQAISKFDWDKSHQARDISDLWVEALNSGNPEKVSKLYMTNSVHVTATRTIQGLPEIKEWYQYLLKQLLPNGKFVITGTSGSGNSRSIHWICKSDKATVSDGRDTFGLINNKIAYHYSYFATKS